MDESRRSFLKKAGVSVLGIGCSAPLAAAIAEAIKAEPTAEGLNAKRWAMVVDLKKCVDDNVFQTCIDACHQIHNVPNIPNPKHEIKWIWTEEYQHAFMEQVHEYSQEKLKKMPALVFCNHCEKPPCVRVCPTQATFKRADGIVMMDQHRCVGCRYCIVACPYGSRSFNFKDPRPFIKNIREDCPTRMKGVVEKCDFCVERLANGLIPACVEACQTKGSTALAFGDILNPQSNVYKLIQENKTIRRRPSLGTAPHVFYII